MIPTLLVEVDWDGDGLFEGGDEDVTANVRSLYIAHGRDGPRGMASPSTCDIVLNNPGRLYSPLDTFLSAKPRRLVNVTTTSPVVAPLFYGRLQEITIDVIPSTGTALGSDLSVAHFQCLSEMGFRLQPRVYTEVVGSPVGNLEPDTDGIGPTSGECVQAVLDALGATGLSIDAGLSEFDTFSTAGETGLDAISRIVDEELGFFYDSKAGTMSFEGRDARAQNLTVAETFSDAPASPMRYSKISPYRYSAESVFNEARGQLNPTKIGGWEYVWSLPLPRDASGNEIGIALQPSETRTFIATWDHPARTAAGAGYSFTGNSKPDGTGEDLASLLTVTPGTLFAHRRDFAVQNTSSSRTVFLASLYALAGVRVRGDASEVKSVDSTSQTTYGERRFPITSGLFGKESLLRDWCQYAVNEYKNPLAMLQVTYRPRTTAQLTSLLQRVLSERVAVINRQLNLTSDSHFWIEKIEHRLQDKQWETVFTLSEARTSQGLSKQYSLFGHATYSRFSTTGAEAGYGSFIG